MIGAVDIGGTKIAAGIVDENGGVLAKAQCPTDVPGGFDHAMHRVAEMLAEGANQSRIRIQGIGIGCTGPVDPISGRLGKVNFFPEWEGCNPVEKLSAAFDYRGYGDAGPRAHGQWLLLRMNSAMRATPSSIEEARAQPLA